MKPSPETAKIFTIILVYVVLCTCSGSNAQDLVTCPPGPNDLLIVDFYGEVELDNFGNGLDSAGDFNKMCKHERLDWLSLLSSLRL